MRFTLERRLADDIEGAWEEVREYTTIAALRGAYESQKAKAQDAYDYRFHIDNGHDRGDRDKDNPLRKTGCLVNEIKYKQVQIVITPGTEETPPVYGTEIRDLGRTTIEQWLDNIGDPETETPQERETKRNQYKTDIDQIVADRDTRTRPPPEPEPVPDEGEVLNNNGGLRG